MQFLYRTHERGSIKVAPDSNLSDFTILIRGVGDSLKDLSVFSLTRQMGSNACGVNNGGCQELCLFNGTHPVCACAHGLVGEDGKSCKGKIIDCVIGSASSCYRIKTLLW